MKLRLIISALASFLSVAASLHAQVTVSPSSLTWSSGETGSKSATVSVMGGGWWSCDSTLYSNHFSVYPQSGPSGSSITVTPVSTNTGSVGIDGGIDIEGGSGYSILYLTHNAPADGFNVNPQSLSWTYNNIEAKTVTVGGSGWSSYMSGSGFIRTENISAGTITVSPAGVNGSTSARSATLVVYKADVYKYVTLTQGGAPAPPPSSGNVSASASLLIWDPYETVGKFVTITSSTGAWRKDTVALGGHFSMNPQLGPSGEMAWFTPAGPNETLSDITDSVFVESSYGGIPAQINLKHKHDPNLLKPLVDSLVWTSGQTSWKTVGVLSSISWSVRVAGGGFKLNTTSGTGTGSVLVAPSWQNPTETDIIGWLELSAPGARTSSVKLIQHGRNAPREIPTSFTGKAGMAIPVNRGITPSGAQTYSVPVFTDPSSKYAPSLQLTYNSQSGNGVAGYGWHISGLSSITLIPQTRYYHGKNKAADVTASEHYYALDGVPLMEDENVPLGLEGYPLKTVRGNIRVKRTSTGFEALYPDGSRAIFGEGPGAQGDTRLIYPVTQMTDVLGNEVIISWLQDNGTCYPNTILYDVYGQSSNEMSFTYTDRSDYVPAYSAGEAVSVRKLLTGITSRIRGATARQYTLTHGVQNGVSCLLELGCSAGSGSSTEQMEPLVFEYGRAAVDTEAQLTQISSNIMLPTPPNQSGFGSEYNLFRGKFFPNSYEDGALAVLGYSNYDVHYENNGHYQCYSGYPSNTPILLVPDMTVSTSAITVTTAGDGFQDVQSLDIDNDGLDELVTVNILAESSTQKSRIFVNTYRYMEGTGSAERIMSHSPVRVEGYFEDGGYVNSQQRVYRYGCLTQDGHAQLITTGLSSDILNRTATSYTAVIDLVSGEMLAEQHLFDITASNANRHFVVDIDGDGISEIVMIENSHMSVYGIKEDGTLGLLHNHYEIKASDVKDGYNLTDVNGDGLIDIVCTSGRDEYWKVFYYTGNAFVERNYPIEPVASSAEVLFADLDSDGLQDVIWYGTDRRLKYRINVGGSLCGETVVTNYTVSSHANIVPARIMDCYGTARFADVSGGEIKNYAYGHKTLLERPLTSLHDSYHCLYKTTYKNIADSGGAYVNTGGTLAMGDNYTEMVFPMVVSDSTMVLSGGIVTEAVKRQYGDASVSTRGIGFICFANCTEYDLLNKYKTVIQYDPAILGAVGRISTYAGEHLTDNVGWQELIVNPVRNAYGNAVDERVMTRISYASLTGVYTDEDYTYDGYGFPISVISRRKVGNDNSSLKETERSVTYSHSLNANCYFLGALTQEVIGEGQHSEKKEYSLDVIMRPVSERSYTGAAASGVMQWHLLDDRQVSYDTYGNIVSERIASYGATTYNETTYSYGTAGRHLVSTTDPLGRTTTFAGYDMYGNPSSETDWLGRQTSYVYDVWGNLVQTIHIDGTVEVTTLSWSPSGEPGVFKKTSTVTGHPSEIIWYDGMGRKALSANQRFDNSWQYIRTEYNAKGLLYRTSLPYKDVSIGPSHWTTYSYDAYGRPVSMVESEGHRTEWSYSGTSTTTSEDGLVSTRTTDADGNVICISDEGGQITYTLRDDGQPSSVALRASGTMQDILTSFSYDVFGRRTSIIDPSAGTRTDSYTDNADGSSSIAHTGPEGTVTTSYDRFGRVISITRPEFSTNYSYGTNLSDSSYGKLLSETSSNGTKKEYVYDALGRVSSEKEYASTTKWLQRSYQYTSGGRIATETYSTQDGSIGTILNTYECGYLTAQTIPGQNPRTIWSLESENALGQPTGVTTGGVERSYGYTSTGLALYRRIRKANTAGYLQDFSYTYNAQNQNMTSRTDAMMESTESFQYDSQNRLMTAVQSWISSESGSGIPMGFEYGSAYTAYDGRGNVVRRSHDGVFDWYGEYSNATDPYKLSGTDWMHSSGDASVNYGAVSMTSFDRPASISPAYSGSGITFTYDADGERVKMELDAPEQGYHVSRWYLGGVYEKDEYPSGSGETDVERLWLGGSAYSAPMAYIKRGSGAWTLYNIGRDVQGSITEVMNYDGDVLEQYRYDPWGVQMCADTLSVPVAVDSLGLGDWAGDVVDTLAVTPLLTRAGRSKYIGSRGWCGHEHLYGYGLINMNARLYDPMTGRFLSPDPLVQDPTSTANFNRYAYCLNNPLKYIDESGESIIGTALITAAIFGIGNMSAHAIRGDSLDNLHWLDYFMQGAFAGAVVGSGLYGIWSIGPIAQYTLYGLGGLHVLSTLISLGGGFDKNGVNGLWNAVKIFIGNFYIDENVSFWQGVGEGILRHTWEFLQTGLGYDYAQFRNGCSRSVERVDYMGGATFVTNEHSRKEQGITIGNFINIDISGEIDCSFDEYILEHSLFMHEYGHTIDSRRLGLSYLFAVGAPSALSAKFSRKVYWTPAKTNETQYFSKHRIRTYERRANKLAKKYFGKHYGVNWDNFENEHPTEVL